MCISAYKVWRMSRDDDDYTLHEEEIYNKGFRRGFQAGFRAARKRIMRGVIPDINPTVRWSRVDKGDTTTPPHVDNVTQCHSNKVTQSDSGDATR
jgi:hypothetical protein